MTRVYLDHNATTKLRPEARAAMLAAMDVVGNPSSVHFEGRAARGLVERARAQVAAAIGAEPRDVVFTSGSTEAAQLWFADKPGLRVAAIEHDAVHAQITETGGTADLPVDRAGQVAPGSARLDVLQAANSETGVVQEAIGRRPVGFCDATQIVGKARFDFATCWCDAVCLSAHKLGGPKGVGALVLNKGIDIAPVSRGGGQEMGRRSGTENVIGIAGFGAAAEAAARDVNAGRWDAVAEFRNILESGIEAEAEEVIFGGHGTLRLPNTSCLILPGWKGETQVMQMDLAGYAVSSGSACSSGKVKASRVLEAMGYDTNEAGSAIRVSLGLETRREDVLGFIEAWTAARAKRKSRAA